MQETPYDINFLLLATTVLILLMGAFIIVIAYLHRKKQQGYQEKLMDIQLSHERNLMAAQLEIQEETFQHISREIHDNIGLSLTLAKLYLHTIYWDEKEKSMDRISKSIELIAKSISQLTDISHSLNADVIIQHGVLKAIDEEIKKIQNTGVFNITYDVTGSPVYLENQKELIIFRIIQEACNNIIKHAHASQVKINLNYRQEKLVVTVTDNGKGFNTRHAANGRQTGLKNMFNRTRTLKGNMVLASQPGQGTILTFIIPLT